MNKLKNYIEQIPDWKQLLHQAGTKGIVQNLPFILYCTALGLVYITMNHMAENTIRKINQTAVQLKEYRWRHVDERSQLMRMTKESELADRALDMGLQKTKVPPHKIVIK
ncbi:MAG: hypothetical protein JNM95_15105 [Chitinophagaceae bacterium]|nr:hypothetical protein [Chitinophagaceae bacterium]